MVWKVRCNSMRVLTHWVHVSDKSEAGLLKMVCLASTSAHHTSFKVAPPSWSGLKCWPISEWYWVAWKVLWWWCYASVVKWSHTPWLSKTRLDDNSWHCFHLNYPLSILVPELAPQICWLCWVLAQMMQANIWLILVALGDCCMIVGLW